MNDLDVNILIQTFNERLTALTTEVVIKEATIKQLKAEMEKMMEVIRTPKTIKKEINKEKINDSEEFK